MLKELNSIANGLLGLHGYPLRSMSGVQATLAEEPARESSESAAPLVQGGGNACNPPKALHSRPTFAW